MKIKNVSGTDLTVPWLGGRLVLDGQPVEVLEGTVFAYTQQESTWAPADEEAQAEHDEGLAACAYALLVQGRVGELMVKTGTAREITKAIKDPETPVAVVVDVLAAELREPEPRTSVVDAAEKRLEDSLEPAPVPYPADPPTDPPAPAVAGTNDNAGTAGEGSDS